MVQLQNGTLQNGTQNIVICYLAVHRWVGLLIQQTSITIYQLPTKKKQTSVLRLQKTKGSLPFPFSVCSKQMKVADFH
jgi:hypothetical protein